MGGGAGGADTAEAAAADAPKDPVSTTAAPVAADAEDDGEDFALLGALNPTPNTILDRTFVISHFHLMTHFEMACFHNNL